MRYDVYLEGEETSLGHSEGDPIPVAGTNGDTNSYVVVASTANGPAPPTSTGPVNVGVVPTVDVVIESKGPNFFTYVVTFNGNGFDVTSCDGLPLSGGAAGPSGEVRGERRTDVDPGTTYQLQANCHNAIGTGTNPEPKTSVTTDNPSVSLTRGAFTRGEGCSRGCYYLDVTASGFRPNSTATLDCWANDGGDGSFRARPISIDAGGNYSGHICAYGLHGHQAWVKLNGFESSNRLSF